MSSHVPERSKQKANINSVCCAEQRALFPWSQQLALDRV